MKLRIISISLTIVIILCTISGTLFSANAAEDSVTITNDVGTKQTITFRIDAGYYAGYYWGTSSNYEDNPYTILSSSTTSVTKTVTTNERYFFFGKHNIFNDQGQLAGYYILQPTYKNSYGSSLYGFPFERINLDANGGSVGYSYLIGLNGNKIDLPIPKREGYVFDGWSSSLTSTERFTTNSFAATSDGTPRTFYARWSIRSLKENEETSVDFNSGETLSYYTFKPSSTANYDIKTIGNIDTVGYLYDKDMNLLYSNDNGDNDSNFFINYDFDAGSSYIIGVKKKQINDNGIKMIAQKTDKDPPSVTYSINKSLFEDRIISFHVTDVEEIEDFELRRIISNSSYESIRPEEENYLGEYEAYYCIDWPGLYRYYATDESENTSVGEISFVELILDGNGGTINKNIEKLDSVVESGKKYNLPTPKKRDYIFMGWNKNKNSKEGVNTITPQNDETYYAIWKAKSTQKITTKSYTKTYGERAFNLNAKTSGNGKLTFKSSDNKVVTVSSKGMINIKGCGKASITIKAAATSKYKAATKKITILVKPPKITGLSAKRDSKHNNSIIFSWRSIKKVSGYRIQVCKSKSFKSGVITTIKTPYNNTKYILTMKTTKKCFFRICAFKTYKGKKYFGEWLNKRIKL